MNRTESYVMSVDKHSKTLEKDMLKLQGVRKSVSLLNKHSTNKHYVKCQGRWGRNNPNYNYRYIPFCPLADAVKWDVYIYSR